MALRSLTMALSRTPFEGLGFSMVLRPGWKGIAMNPLHGAFISSAEFPQEAVLNVRGLAGDHEFPLTRIGLEQLLRAQDWGALASDVSSEESGAFAMAGGSFAPVEGRGEWVREWFVSDGRSLASCLSTPMICLQPELVAECEEMIRSLRFD